jgi:hypothetical protein
MPPPTPTHFPTSCNVHAVLTTKSDGQQGAHSKRRRLTSWLRRKLGPRPMQARMRRRFAFGCRMMRVRLRESVQGAALEFNGQL